MDITIYLPDDLGKWAKEHNLGLSRMLRDAVEAERQRQNAVAETLASAETHDLTVEDDDGNPYTARLHAALIAEQDSGVARDVYAYLGKDELVYVYDERASKLYRGVSTEELRDWLYDDQYAAAMRALGEEVVIDVGLPE